MPELESSYMHYILHYEIQFEGRMSKRVGSIRCNSLVKVVEESSKMKKHYGKDVKFNVVETVISYTRLKEVTDQINS